ncbi:MAG: DUF485 domain-containing protein [Gammaproteobacteria bacterium]|nr:DUF485 domain-containing protein [Gammaproteobacteria bacterium]
MDHCYRAIDADPRFHALARARSRLGWGLGGVMLVTYYAFILVIAFRPAWLARPLSSTTVITVGIAAGVALIVLGVALTGVYIWQANRSFDARNRAIVDAARRAV